LRPPEAFDRVLETVRRYQANQHRIPAVPLKRESSGGRPQVGNWRTEYIAEFELCGRIALKPWPRRYQLFQVYFVKDVPYTTAVKLLEVKPGTFDWWAKEIKYAVGVEIMRRRLHKPLQYQEPSGKKTTDLAGEVF
jgi:hypothetical protein